MDEKEKKCKDCKHLMRKTYVPAWRKARCKSLGMMTRLEYTCEKWEARDDTSSNEM